MAPKLRYIYNGQRPRNGKVVVIPAEAIIVDDSHGEDGKHGGLPSATIIQMLKEEPSVDLERFAVNFYDKEGGGWRSLPNDGFIPLYDSRIELMLEDKSLWRGNVLSHKLKVEDESGYFGIGVYHMKQEANLGTLWRSAYQLGASYMFTLGARFEPQASDTMKSWLNLPVFRYDNFETFANASPYAAPWVAVEMGGTPLHEFKHPPRAVYILGAEDMGLPGNLVKACAHHISLPAVRTSSYNVSVAGSIVMYDRYVKRAQGLDAPIPKDTEKKAEPTGEACS